MASSSSKPTGVHFALIFFVMATLILGILYYLFGIRRLQEERAKADQATASASKANTDFAAASEHRTRAMQTFGVPGASYDEAENGLKTQMTTLGVNQEKQTVLATLEALRGAYDTSTAENATLKQELETERNKLLEVQREYQSRNDQTTSAQKESEALVQKTRADMDEIVQERDRKIAQLDEDLRRERIEKEQIREQAGKTEKSLNDELARLTSTVDVLRDRIENYLKTSFETADGEIVTVDANLGIVFINLGSEDNLKPQVSFSVYSRNNRGIGREARDIKGRVEVTRILGPHLAEARIIEQDRTRPISELDPIYSPIWAGGRPEYFALVGLIDFDNDGQSDRETLHRVLKNAGAGIDLEVNDDGVREPTDAKITANTKFLILGGIPDPSTLPSNDEKRLKAERMMAEREALIREARSNGVRWVNLADFLVYMGYKPQQRFYVPGQSTGYTLENGARTPAVRSDSPAAGQTSKLFENLQREEETGIKSFRK